MLKYIIALSFIMASAALAETLPPSSPPSSKPDVSDMVAAYKLLLTEANDRIAAMSAQVQANARRADVAEKALINKEAEKSSK